MKTQVKVSAGLLMFRVREGRLEVFLAHPGGPFFAKKDDGHWSIPKGETGPGEEPVGWDENDLPEQVYTVITMPARDDDDRHNLVEAFPGEP